VIDLTEIVAESLEIRKLCAPPNLNRAAAPIVRAEYMDGCYVSGCPDQFTEMTLNFLKNATEACLEGGEMVIRTAHDAKNVTLSVEDTGHGIPENDYEQIFQPFWTTRESHVGIGLTVNQGIAQRCGAVIAVKSESGKGACFSVTFPLAVKKEARVSIYPAADPDRRLSILLIDDDRPVVTILEKGLKKQKQNTYIALSGQDGLDIFEHTEVDCIVCDLAMQGMDGWEVSRAIQAVCMEKGIAKPPFILLTGWAGQLAQGEIARHPDVDRIVEKPVTIPSLLAIIREEVSKSEFA
jgi:CheY-like chemotaxis protein